MVAGPNNLVALVSSLQMGFKTLAIEQRSIEIGNVLAAVKTEFNKFGDLLEKTSKNLEQAQNNLHELSGRRTRAIERKLVGVESLPEADAQKLLETE
jgi:DNA recombination protein RmuC